MPTNSQNDILTVSISCVSLLRAFFLHNLSELSHIHILTRKGIRIVTPMTPIATYIMSISSSSYPNSQSASVEPHDCCIQQVLEQSLPA